MLRVEGLVKSFGGVRAVDGVSFAVRPGEVFGLLGPNGAGKSTTIHMAVGLLAPDAGRVEIGGLGDPREPEVRRGVGVAPQAIALYEELTALENLEFFGRVYGLAAPRARAEALLGRTGLSDRARDRVEGFSGGMKRRLNLAAALMHDPRLVLLDEPTAGVDPQSRNAIFEIVRELRGAGVALLYTTHYMEEAEKLCDRVAILDHGRVLALDTVDRLIEAHGGGSMIVVQREAGEERIRSADPARDVAALLANGGVRGLRVERADLETVFLSLTGRSLRDE